jgi:hypothetical protein
MLYAYWLRTVKLRTLLLMLLTRVLRLYMLLFPVLFAVLCTL